MLSGCFLIEDDNTFLPDASRTVREYRESMAIIDRSQTPNKPSAIQAVNGQTERVLLRYASWRPKCNSFVNRSNLIVYRQLALQFRAQMIRPGGRGYSASTTQAVMSEAALAELISIEAVARQNCARGSAWDVPAYPGEAPRQTPHDHH